MRTITNQAQGSQMLRWRDLLHLSAAPGSEIPTDMEVPDSLFQDLLSELLERDYLNEASRMEFLEHGKAVRRINWLQIERLPLHPGNAENYDLIFRWQGVLSTMHAWGYRVIFLLLRSEGETHLYLGTAAASQTLDSQTAIEQIREATFGSMPGIGLRPLERSEPLEQIIKPMLNMRRIGAVTGIPSFRKTQERGAAQTLDQLAFGLQDSAGYEKNYAMMVIADPIADEEISDIIARYRCLGSKLHTDVSQSLSNSASQTQGVASSVGTGIGGGLGLAISALTHGAVPAGTACRIGCMLGGKVGRQLTVGRDGNISRQYLDKFAQYSETLTDTHVKRLQEGRNLGFWNAGVYVLGESATDVGTVMGILRSIYSGENTYIEPIRTHLLHGGQESLNTLVTVRDRCELLPMASREMVTLEGVEPAEQEWHPLGRYYQYLSTPVNTMELSLYSSLPRRDVPGIRFSKSSVHFVNNPSPVAGDAIGLGALIDTGVVQNTQYQLDVNALVRHALITGATGCGKSTTSKRILRELLQKDIPVLIIEPAKDDYVRWAIEMNRSLPKEKRFSIYMPGVKELNGVTLDTLQINPFEPAAADGAPVDLLTHSENLTALLNASLPASDVLPIIIDETVYNYMLANFGRAMERGSIRQSDEYPLLEGMADMAQSILKARGYEQKVQDNLSACLKTRFGYLTRGARGQILNVPKSTPFATLFDRPTVINISRIAGQKDKALIMAILVLALYEYRVSIYNTSDAYRTRAQQNRLLHLTLIEEAHNLLLKPAPDAGGGNAQQAVADLFGNMLSEIRGYGEGLLIADQVPTRLIPDAIKNTNYKIVHRLTAPDDIEVMASSLALREDQKALIPSLQIGQAIVFGDQDDGAAWVKIHKG